MVFHALTGMVLAGVVALSVSGCSGDSTGPVELLLSFTAESSTPARASFPRMLLRGVRGQ